MALKRLYEKHIADTYKSVHFEYLKVAEGKRIDVYVKCQKDIVKGALKLVPLTKTVAFIAKTADYPLGALPIPTDDLPLPVSPGTGRLFLSGVTPDVKAKSWFIPHWLVRTTVDSSKSNMGYEAATLMVEGTTISVPVMTNTKKIKAGDELLMYANERKRGIMKEKECRGKGIYSSGIVVVV